MTFNPKIEASINALQPQAALTSKYNITGLYRGTAHDDKALFHFNSVGITNIPWLGFVFGVGKVYHLGGDSPHSTLFPVQGFLVTKEDYSSEITAFAAPFVNRKLALEIDLGFLKHAPGELSANLSSSDTSPLDSTLFHGNFSSLTNVNSTRPPPVALNVSGAPGLRVVAYSSISDLKLLSSPQNSISSQKVYQLLDEELLPANFRPLLYPKTDVEMCDYTMQLIVTFDEQPLLVGESTMASEISGEARSSDCPAFNLTLQSTRLTAELLDRKINAYVTLALLVCLAQIGFFVVQLRYSSTLGTLGKISILCLCSQALMDSMLCVAHLMLCAAFSKYSIPFLSVAALELLLFSVFGMRCVIGVYQTRYAQELAREGVIGLRQRFAFLQARFCLSLFGIIFILYLFKGHPFIWFILFSVWVPQIVWNAVAGTRLGLSYIYLFGTGISRLILPLYVMCCPRNMFAIIFEGLVYAPVTCLTLVAWTALQLVVLVLQDLFGPRFFVPKFLLPARYDYFRPLSNALVTSNDEQVDIEQGLLPECVICYCVVEGEHMITPCDHVFHKQCLGRWMELKLECPVCRTNLPPLDS